MENSLHFAGFPVTAKLRNMADIMLTFSVCSRVTFSDSVTILYVTISTIVRHYARLMADALSRVKSYLARQSDKEPNPYYQGRYLVALLVCAYNHVAHPYEVAELVFKSSRLAQKIESWLENRCERFPYLAVRFDGSLGEWKEAQVMAPKKPAAKVRAKKAGAA